jgi:uncharacterized pyridoxamine 5'-phosphate oxidase family protein
VPDHDLWDYARIHEWLQARRYVIMTSLRKDGSPLSVPVAFHYDLDEGYLYFTIQNVRAGVQRIRRDQRIAICTVDNADGQPPTDFRIHARAEEHPDPDHRISKIIAHRAVEGRPGYDFPKFLENWLSHGRVVFRVPVNDQTTRFKDGLALVQAVEEGRASFESDGAGTGGADGKTLFADQVRLAGLRAKQTNDA